MAGVSITMYRAAIGLYCGGLVGESLYFKLHTHEKSNNCLSDNNIYVLLLLFWCNIVLVTNLMSQLALPAMVAMMYMIQKEKNRYIFSCLKILKTIMLLLLISGDVHLNPGPQLTKCLSICHCNIRSLNNEKLRHIEADLSKKYKIITLSETWLRDGCDTSNLILHNYHPPLIKNRYDGSGYGGLLVWISNDLSYRRVLTFEKPHLEIIWFEINHQNHKILIGNTYRPPNSHVGWWDNLQMVINEIIESKVYNNILFVGDLNAHIPSTDGNRMLKFLDHNNMYHLIDTPTRVTEYSSTILDQFIINNKELVYKTLVEDPVSTNDHCTIGIWLKFSVPKKKCYQRLMWDFTNCNYERFNDILSEIDFSFCDNITDIDSCVLLWTEKVYKAALEGIPNKLVTVRPYDKPWYSGRLRKLLRSKKRLYKRAMVENTNYNWSKYKNVRNKYYQECKNQKLEYEKSKYSKLIDEGRLNNKKWWKLLKDCVNISDSSTSIPPLHHNNIIISDEMEKTNIFNEFFTNVTKLNVLNTHDLNIETIIPIGETLNDIKVTEEDVLDQLKILDINKAFGLDKISPRFLKFGKLNLYKSLTHIFNHCLDHGIFPSVWKISCVNPLYKKGEPNLVGNYRPISLLSTLSKVFEKIIFKYTYNFFLEQNLITPFQSGFLPGFSTITQLIELQYIFAKSLDNHCDTRIIFLDISKAFDRVWHDGLIFKLKLNGITGNLLQWFESYLTNRQQCVRIGSNVSSLRTIEAGVPQGSVLGPLLFLIFINDLVTKIEFSNIRLFADDTCIFLSGENMDDVATKLNNDLKNIEEWSQNWLVEFSASKTKSLNISNSTKVDCLPNLFLNTAVIENVTQHKHLGLILDQKLSWTDHVDLVISNCMKRLNIMKKLKYVLDRKSLETIYKSFIRPMIEYGNVIYFSTSQKNLDRLCKIEKEAKRLTTGATHRCNLALMDIESGWTDIVSRRNNHCLIMMFKIINNLCPGYLKSIFDSFTTLQHDYNLRNQFVKRPKTRTETFAKSFFPYTLRLWNSLPLNHRLSNNLNIFKNKIIKKDKDRSLFKYGPRHPQILLSRIRMGCSALNGHLFHFLKVLNNPSCECGFPIESPDHYFLSCPLYAAHQQLLHREVSNISTVNINVLLFGNKSCSRIENELIFNAVYRFIMNTKRFKLQNEVY